MIKDRINTTKPRQKKYWVKEDEWIRSFLRECAVGTLAFSFEDTPYLNANCFVYDEDSHCIYFHTAISGRVRSMVSENPKCVFNAFEVGRFLPADTALQFSVEYKSVVVFGKAEILDSHEEKVPVLQMILDKYAPHKKAGVDYQNITRGETDATSVYRIDIEDWSAKEKSVEPDFPGAFTYPYAAS